MILRIKYTCTVEHIHLLVRAHEFGAFAQEPDHERAVGEQLLVTDVTNLPLRLISQLCVRGLRRRGVHRKANVSQYSTYRLGTSDKWVVLLPTGQQLATTDQLPNEVSTINIYIISKQ